jgi:hypothetical protein
MASFQDRQSLGFTFYLAFRGPTTEAPGRHSPLSLTMKQAAVSSTDQGGGKRRPGKGIFSAAIYSIQSIGS